METYAIENEFYQAFLARPDISPCDANRALVSEWLADNLKPTTAANIVEAFTALGKTLARNLDAVAAVKPTVAATPAPVVSAQDHLRRLKQDIHSRHPALVAAATAELSKLADAEGKVTRFNRLYTRKSLASMSKPEVDAVVRMYGAQLVSARLNQD